MKNAAEGAVRALHDALLREHAEFCSCVQCRDDVVTLALNHIRPRYVSGRWSIGEVLTDVALTYDQDKVELTVAVFDAMRRVAASPRHADSADPGAPEQTM